ncbi:MAG: type II toxin-antitoxin system VapC family toxin [Limnoraphis robusta]|uniref:Type II toxin-antitoxin system VapC family toxin n=1 Tax=Limnoraphis robusta CCNP1315 TaxID=3110306 RepID=A0ABU5U1J0_9CYAN|nr:type II toxin-antitoxin system VapC family toxin [Limnoraphis robusta]MEA5495764.1 type II toxin-antitoxin system VapC family toxin [Limnoraphis robusta BA-68 BA1]MEA5521060.1 type II toxin-antitoxin system VapC family toxin [Limnoraphis robusta CCNP1315]MEA5543495.1 type II toxin-antitoxin system VapC family toxin [Limnoraphis robusta CCNP1324]
MFLLDTNHCSYAILGNTQVLEYLASLGDQPIATCTIVKGELIDMAARSQQREANLALIQRFLSGLYIYPIDETTAEIYGKLKAAVFDRYAPKDKSQRRRTNITQLGMGENDLWIAAVAVQHQLTLVTADQDFQRIQAVQPFNLESWV